MQSAAQALPPSARALKVYFEVNSAPYAAGESSFIGETLLRLGAKNIVPASMGPFPKLNPEFVVRAAPDLIMVGDSDPSAFGTRPGWQRIPAVRNQHVCVFGRADSDVLVRPGPRMAEGAQLMAACLRKFAP
jgi:iron complex transport system substrate-binding protein